MNNIAGRNINNPRNIKGGRWYPPYGRKRRGTEEPLDESERGDWKRWLKLNIQKTKIMTSSLITSWQIDGKTMETLKDFIILDSNITAIGDFSLEIKDACSLEEKLWPA